MPMEELPVAVAVESPKLAGDDVVDLGQVSIAEEQSTVGAPSALPAEEPSDEEEAPAPETPPAADRARRR